MSDELRQAADHYLSRPQLATDGQVAELKRLCEAATPGPWEIDPCSDNETLAIHSTSDDHVCLIQLDDLTPNAESDAALIAAARNFVPTLIARLERAEAELRDIKETHRAIVTEDCSPVEKHCSCVPALRAEIERLREDAERLIDFDNDDFGENAYYRQYRQSIIDAARKEAT